MRKAIKLVFTGLLLAFPMVLTAQTTPINCPSGFNSGTTGTCGLNGTVFASTGYPWATFGNASSAGLSGSTFVVQPIVTHTPDNINFQTPVGVQNFTATFEFAPNAWNLAFVLENATMNGGAGPPGGFTLAQAFTSGAGCEGAFYQAFSIPGGDYPPNNIFVLNFDSGNLLINSLTPFYSNVQIYQQLQSPCIPNDGQPWFYYTNKVSTSPVPMNSPATTYQTSTGDTYSATIIYTGTAVTVNLYDVTASGTCSPVTSGTCFTYTWPNVTIPSLVDGTTAYMGFGGSTNGTPPNNLVVDNLVYTIPLVASTPTFSPTAGTYGSTQTVTISSTSSGSTICYNTTGSPYTDGNGNCPNGTKYTGTISVSKGQTLYAVAGSGSTTYGDSPVGSAAYNITGFAATPTFNQPGGTWQGNQTVQLTTAHGGVICYSTSTTPATNGTTGCTTGTLYSTPILVSSNETINAIAGGTGFTDSPVGSATYVISPFAVVDSTTGSYPANSPTFSPVAGTYSGTQTVTLATTTTYNGSTAGYLCYIAASSPPSLLPTPDNHGGCNEGTFLASGGTVSVSSSETIYAIASTIIGASVSGTGPPSSISTATYNISGGSATAPSCTPTSGSSSSPITVTCSNSNSGTTIMCYTENGSTPVTNGSGTGCTTGTSLSGSSNNITISSTVTTLEVVAGTSTLSDSSASTYGAYTITPSASGSQLSTGNQVSKGNVFQ